LEVQKQQSFDCIVHALTEKSMWFDHIAGVLSHLTFVVLKPAKIKPVTELH